MQMLIPQVWDRQGQEKRAEWKLNPSCFMDGKPLSSLLIEVVCEGKSLFLKQGLKIIA